MANALNCRTLTGTVSDLFRDLSRSGAGERIKRGVDRASRACASRRPPWHHIEVTKFVLIHLRSQEADGFERKASGLRSSHVSAGRSTRRSRRRSGLGQSTPTRLHPCGNVDEKACSRECETKARNCSFGLSGERNRPHSLQVPLECKPQLWNLLQLEF